MFEAIKFVSREHIKNIYTIWNMGVSHAKKQTLRTSLGIWWILIRDMVYFAAFILFRYLMSGGGEIEGMHYMVYLITGLIPWFFINEVLNGGAMAIKVNSAIIKSIRFPITIIPSYEVIAIFYRRMFTLIVPIIVILMFGEIRLIKPLLFIYYFVCMFVLMICFNLVTSAFVAISHDFFQLYMSITRILIFIMPVIWSFELVKNIFWINLLLKLNPMVYVINGFRDAYVLGGFQSSVYTVYFWICCIIIFMIGSIVQFKLRRVYSDFM